MKTTIDYKELVSDLDGFGAWYVLAYVSEHLLAAALSQEFEDSTPRQLEPIQDSATKIRNLCFSMANNQDHSPGFLDMFRGANNTVLELSKKLNEGAVKSGVSRPRLDEMEKRIKEINQLAPHLGELFDWKTELSN